MISYQERLIDEKVFRDPVHNYIKVDHQLILDLINAKEMQRLRHIKQLGTSSFTFHGSEHSRFTHSLGVYEIARKICNIFNRYYPKGSNHKDGWDDSQRLLTLVAALLHDIGHGAYSHTFEHIFNTDHEQFTIDIITSNQTEVFQILHHFAKDFPGKVAQVIQKNYRNQQVVQIISSQIDADRMDYLLRDAYYTGTKYGTFDLTRILRTIRPVRDGIAFKASGMHAVEDYIISRYQMYMQVYFHPTSRAMEIILKHLLKRARACALYQEKPDYFRQTAPRLLTFLKGEYKLEDYLFLNDNVLNTYFAEWKLAKDPVLSDLAIRFLERKPLKSCAFTNQSKAIIDEMRKLVAAAGFASDYYTAISSSYDLPYDFYHPSTKNAQIDIMLENGQLTELSTMSPLVLALAENAHGEQRFYFPKEMLNSSQIKFNQLRNSL